MNVLEFDSIGEDEKYLFSKSKVSQSNVSGLFLLQECREKHIYWIKKKNKTNKQIKTLTTTKRNTPG